MQLNWYQKHLKREAADVSYPDERPTIPFVAMETEEDLVEKKKLKPKKKCHKGKCGILR